MDGDADMLTLHDVRPEDRRTHELLELLLAEVRGLRADLAPASRVESSVVGLIAKCPGTALPFSASDLVDHCRLAQAAALRAALTDACGGVLDARRVGKLLQRIQNVPQDGIVIRRHGEDREGALWICGSAGVTPTTPVALSRETLQPSGRHISKD